VINSTFTRTLATLPNECDYYMLNEFFKINQYEDKNNKIAKKYISEILLA